MDRDRVVVAMSGGVDSSVAAALLKTDGYEVCGVNLKLLGQSGQCRPDSGLDDARRVASKLGIPFYDFDVSKDFDEKVVKYFCDAYIRGVTPNPCVACNRRVKFDSMLKIAAELGAGHIATGHYAKIEYSEEKGRYLLKKADDSKKDQSYVLYCLTQDQLKRTLLPLGGLAKAGVREIAAKLGLPVADRPESQDICFVRDQDYADFIEKRTGVKSEPGFFTDRHGRKLGTHRGQTHYTIGQRKRLGVSLGEPMYVIEKNTASNTVILGSDDELYNRRFSVGDLNFISTEGIEKETEADVKIRYSSTAAGAILKPSVDRKRLTVEFETPQRAVAPGQSAVFYDGDEVIGGGLIEGLL